MRCLPAEAAQEFADICVPLGRPACLIPELAELRILVHTLYGESGPLGTEQANRTSVYSEPGGCRLMESLITVTQCRGDQLRGNQGRSAYPVGQSLGAQGVVQSHVEELRLALDEVREPVERRVVGEAPGAPCTHRG